MNDPRAAPRWTSEAWRVEAASFIDAALARQGHRRIGPVEQPHVRPWATALKARTTRGDVWLKAPCARMAGELSLYPILFRVAPERVFEPLTIDLERGLLLLPDGGTSLGATAAPEITRALEPVMAQYAQLQLALAPHVAELLSAGATDMRAPIMPQRFEQALDCVSAQLTDDAAEHEVCERVRGTRETFLEQCRRLGELSDLASIDHGDLHPWNVFIAGQSARFLDWGDSVVAHPFASALVALRVLRAQLETTDDDPRLLRVRDAYLEPFAAHAPRAVLLEALDLACRVARVARVLVWERSVAEHGRGDPQFARAPFETLRAVLKPSYLS